MSTQTTDERRIETTVSWYDIVNALLISSIVVIGTVVTVLFLIWLTMLLNNRQPETTNFVVDNSIGNEKPEGFEDDIFEPGVEEFPEVDVPQLADALEALTEAVSAVRANIETRDGDAMEMGRGKGFGSREGGPGTGNAIGVPEHKRWKIEYDTPSIADYARQLSFFDIDIGVVSKASNDIVRLKDPGNSPQIARTVRETESKSLYFVHEKQRLRRWDESLAKKNGVEMTDRFTVQFYPEATRVILRQEEARYLAENKIQLKDVLKTKFKVVEQVDGFVFRITSVDHK